MNRKRAFTLALAIALSGAVNGAAVAASRRRLTDSGAMKGRHFDPNGNLPSTFTLELRKGVVATLPFAGQA